MVTKAKANKKFVKHWNELVDLIFDTAAELDWSWADLARNADLSYHCVWNMGNRYTVFPNFYTVWKLAKATGITVTFKRVEVEAEIKATRKKVRV